MNTFSSSPAGAPAPFRGQVLTRIYRVWLIRTLLPVMAAEVVVLAGAIYWFGRMVFVQRVLENALRVLFENPPAMLSFIVGAFAHTATFNKILVIAIAVLFALVLRHLTQGVLRFILVKKRFFARQNEDAQEKNLP